jgi:iron complex outermembrane receptor protein
MNPFSTMRISHRTCFSRWLFLLQLSYFFLILLIVTVPATAEVQAQKENKADIDTEWIDIEELSQLRIVTASKRFESIEEVPAAVRVVTSEDIKRSGATTIPEALRNIPGLNVAQINNSAWAIGARGFMWQYANKLLVMRDGRSLYSPVFGGVTWDTVDYFLEDIDRIEVVLGPGSSIWGANAMNGVINIITKSAKETQGALIYAGGGNEKQLLSGARAGWKINENIFGRVYAKYSVSDDTRFSTGSSGNDSTNIGQAGFRLDGDIHRKSIWTVQGDAFWGDEEYEVNVPSLAAAPNYFVRNDAGTNINGANILVKWETEFNPSSKLQLQTYYDYYKRKGAIIDETLQTFDIELHHALSVWDRHQIDWGLGYRFVDHRSSTSEDVLTSFDPQDNSSPIFSGFIQDKISLIPGALSLTAGVKIEKNDFTDFEVEPSVRLLGHPDDYHTIWAAWSRAIRMPTFIETFGDTVIQVIPPSPPSQPVPLEVRLLGNDDLNSEELNAWEIGWRWQFSNKLYFDTSGFYYDYDQLYLLNPGTYTMQPSQLPSLVIPVTYDNGISGKSFGGEFAVSWKPVDNWFLRVSYSYVKIQLDAHEPDPQNFEGAENSTPRNTIALQSYVNLGKSFDFNAAFRYVDSITNESIPSYCELDAVITWRPLKGMEVSLVGQNLLDSSHPEYAPGIIGETTEIERSFYGKMTWRF